MSHTAAPQGWFAESLRICGTLFAHFLTQFLVLLVLCKVVPIYTVLFARIDAELPPMTQLLILVSHRMISYWPLVLFLLMVVDGAIIVLLRWTNVTRLWLLPLWCNLWYLGVILFLVYITAALSVPIQDLSRIEGEIVIPPW
jgi:type II secretory pathway component PulF